MKYKTKKINHCLLCKNKNIKEVFSLGNLFVSNFVKKKDIKNGIKAPLNLLYCGNCSLIQLSHIAPQEIMYRRFYWYKSGINETINNDLKEISKIAVQLGNLQENDIVLDIGANDGTLLRHFKQKAIRVGCEPANNLIEDLNDNCEYLINDFWNEKDAKNHSYSKRTK